jgi:hypothetical protein
MRIAGIGEGRERLWPAKGLFVEWVLGSADCDIPVTQCRGPGGRPALISGLYSRLQYFQLFVDDFAVLLFSDIELSNQSVLNSDQISTQLASKGVIIGPGCHRTSAK